MTLPPLFTDRGGSVFVSPPTPSLKHMLVRDHMLLTLATTPYRYPGARAADMLELTGYTETRFWARVNHLLDLPAVERERPTEVRRLRRLRDARKRARCSRVAPIR